MPLGFLLPKLAWFAALALGPLLIHLLNRIRLRHVPFSSLIFLREVKRERFNWLRLKELLLLILRTALLLFLFLGLSRPFLKSGLFGARREASAVLIIDNSLSMRYGDAGDRARQAARTYLGQLTGTSEAAVITATDPRAAFLTRDLRHLTAMVDSIAFSYADVDLGAAVEQAQDLLNRSTLPQKEIVVFTDLQKRALATLPAAGATILLKDCGNPAWRNCAVTSVVPLERLPQPGKPTGLTARVRNYGNTDETRVVTLKVDGATESRTVSIPAGDEKAVDFEKQLVEPGEHAGSVGLDPDSLRADDEFFFAVNIPRAIPVLIVGDAPEDILYLSRALAPESLGFFRVDTRPSAGFRTADLRRYQVVALVNPTAFTAFDWQRVSEYLANGGSLFLALGREPRDKTFTGRYANYAADVKLTGFVTIEQADYAHPLLEAFKGRADLSIPRFYRHARIEPVNARVLARFSDGAPFLLESNAERVIVAASDLRLDGTDLPLKALFLPLLHRTFAYLGQEPLGRSYSVGDTIAVPAPLLGRLKVRTPESEYSLAADPGARGTIRFGDTGIPGNYGLGERTCAVNVSPFESDLTRASESELTRHGITLLQDVRGKTRDLTNLLLTIAGLCLLAEMLVLVL